MQYFNITINGCSLLLIYSQRVLQESKLLRNVPLYTSAYPAISKMLNANVNFSNDSSSLKIYFLSKWPLLVSKLKVPSLI